VRLYANRTEESSHEQFMKGLNSLLDGRVCDSEYKHLLNFGAKKLADMQGNKGRGQKTNSMPKFISIALSLTGMPAYLLQQVLKQRDGERATAALREVPQLRSKPGTLHLQPVCVHEARELLFQNDYRFLPSRSLLWHEALLTQMLL